jgi:uncharacterized membrane protein
MDTMKTRQEMKMNARNILRAHQGQVIGAYLVAMVIAMVVTSVTAGFGSFLVMPVLMVTMKGFFHAMYTGRAMRLEDAGKCLFDNRYLTKTGGYLWMCLLTGLWSCLFVIPGIVMGIAYSMTPYILHDCPNVKAMDAVKISRRMTRGYKVDLFVAELSFLGWELLGLAITAVVTLAFLIPDGFFAQIPGGDLNALQASLYAVLDGSVYILVSNLALIPLQLWLHPYREVTRAGFYDARLRLHHASSPTPPPL